MWSIASEELFGNDGTSEYIESLNSYGVTKSQYVYKCNIEGQAAGAIEKG